MSIEEIIINPAILISKKVFINYIIILVNVVKQIFILHKDDNSKW